MQKKFRHACNGVTCCRLPRVLEWRQRPDNTRYRAAEPVKMPFEKGVECKNERLRPHAKSPCLCESVKDNEIAETKGFAVALAACGSHAVVNQNQGKT